jgi:hypothetical protein
MERRLAAGLGIPERRVALGLGMAVTLKADYKSALRTGLLSAGQN